MAQATVELMTTELKCMRAITARAPWGGGLNSMPKEDQDAYTRHENRFNELAQTLGMSELEAIQTCDKRSEFGDMFETFMGSGKFDAKGREIGWTVGFRDNGTDFHAWVQNARRLKNGEFHDFGVAQRSKKFDSQEAANRWAYATAKARIAKLKA